MVNHPAFLRGLAFDAQGAPSARVVPLMIEVADDQFIAALLAGLRTPEGRRALMTQAREGSDVTLLQPVHRTFQVALFEAVCDVPGEPPLDRAAIESAGLVVRRIVRDAEAEVTQGWFSREGREHAWRRLDRTLDGLPLADLDPDPKRRRPIETGNAAVDEAVKALRDDPHRARVESVTSLFVAPPDVCQAVGRTVLYGVIPTASGEAEEPDDAPSFTDADVNADFPPWLAANVTPAFSALAGQTLRHAHLADDDGGNYRRQLRGFATFLRKLRVEYRALGDASVRSDAFHRALATLALPELGAADVALEAAARCLVDGATESWLAPPSWPAISAAQDATLRAAAKAALTAQAGRVVPRVGRFDTRNTHYHVRGFMRVRGEARCPAKLQWSKEGVAFQIAPWHAAGRRPPVLVTLPAVTSDNIKSFLPNVSFSVPGAIQALLSDNSPEDFLKGRAKTGSGALDWICGFNIPLITLCAFIVLSIFLVLLNIVFWWLPFIKVCIPIPSSLRSRLDGGSAS